jgi:hypothetical protein
MHGASTRRRAYILFVALGFVAVATALGLAFLDANSTVMPAAVNYHASLRAQYQAGSGVALAQHYIMYPPTSVPYGSYWTGAGNISVDGGVDYCNVNVLRADGWSPALSDPNRYRITATGVACDADGAVRARKTVTVDVQAPLTQKWQIPYAYLSTGSVAVTSATTIKGDMHSNGTLSGLGWCNGKLTAVSACSWSGTGPPISQASSTPTFTPVPTASVSSYTTYTILGRSHTAYTGFSSSTMTQSDAAALNAIDMSATNPGRIIIAPAGDFRVRGNVSLSGTLVVSGRCEFDDAGNHAITAVNYFPSLVSTGDLQMRADNMNITLVGPVICGGRIDNNSRTATNLDVTGPWISATQETGTRSDSVLTFTYSAQRSVFWDLQNALTPPPITVLSWTEN